MSFLTTKSIEEVKGKFAGVINIFIPGIIILEGFFNKGLFAGGISSLYDFILYLVWGSILSLPLNFFCPAIVCHFKEALIPKLNKDLEMGMDNETIEKIIEEEDDDEKDEEVELFFYIIQSFFMIATLKVLIWLELITEPIVGINPVILHLGISYLIAILMGYPMGYILTKILYLKGKAYFRKANKIVNI